MAVCELCGKKPVMGRNSKHKRGVASAKFANKAKKVAKLFRPNIQKISLFLQGHQVSGKFCATCIKKMKGQEAQDQAKKVKSKK